MWSVRGWSLGCGARIARMLGRSSSVIRGGIKRNAGADGCCWGGEAGRMAARRRARPKECALDAGPVLRSRAWSGPRGARVPLDQRAPQGPERVAGVGCHVLVPQQPVGARSATRRLCTWIHTPSEEGPRRSTGSCCPRRRDAQECPITSHQPLPGRHRRRTGQLPPRHPRLPHPTRGIHPTHCHLPLTPPTASLNRAQGAPSPPLAL